MGGEAGNGLRRPQERHRRDLRARWKLRAPLGAGWSAARAPHSLENPRGRAAAARPDGASAFSGPCTGPYPYRLQLEAHAHAH